jgi:hypothetical protein
MLKLLCHPGLLNLAKTLGATMGAALVLLVVPAAVLCMVIDASLTITSDRAHVATRDSTPALALPSSGPSDQDDASDLVPPEQHLVLWIKGWGPQTDRVFVISAMDWAPEDLLHVIARATNIDIERRP